MFKALTISLLVLGGWFYAQQPTLAVGNTTLFVEMAHTPKEKARGLSGHLFLPKNKGMLFVFEKPGTHGFWMKDMRFALDIIWIDGEKKVVDVAHRVSPDSFPQTFYPKTPASYVLEVNAGFAEERGIELGDRVEF